MQKKLLGLLEPQAAKCQKFLCIGSEAQEFFCIGSEIAPSWHLSDLMQKKRLGILIRAKYPNKRTSDLMQKKLSPELHFPGPGKGFY